MYIPDLFGAYVKGRELAVEKNWQDLKNFETIEDARNQNDLNAMDIWERRQQMPGKMSMFYNQAQSSDMAMEVLRAAQRGKLALANTSSDVAVGDYAIYKQHEQDYLNKKSGMLGARIGQQANAVQNLLGQNEYLAPIARELGKIYASAGANQVRANGVLGDNLVNAAQQGVILSDEAFTNNRKANRLQGKQLDSAIIQQPYVHGNTMYDLRNYIPSQTADKTAQGNQQLLSFLQEQSSLYDKLSTVTDPATRQALQSQIAYLQDYMYGMGYTPDTTIPIGAGISSQATPTVNPPQNSVPVGTNSVLAPTGTPQTNQPVQDIRSLLPPMFQNPNGGQVYNYPVSPEHGQYRPLVPRQNSVGATGGSGSVVAGGQTIYY